MKVVTFNLRCDTPNDGENRWEFRKGLVLDKLDAENPISPAFRKRSRRWRPSSSAI